MDDKLAKAIEFIKLLRWQYPPPSKLDEIDKFIFECEKEAAQLKYSFDLPKLGISKEKLQKLFEEYAATLDDMGKDEWIESEVGISNIVFKEFMAWLEKHNA